MLPHLVDTVLLVSALGMLWIMRLLPWATPWLRAKIIGLIQAPATKLAQLTTAPAAKLARVVGAYAAKDAA